MKKITIKYLKQHYPKPVTSNDDDEGAYCVGGAFMLARGRRNDFPFAHQLRDEIDLYRKEMGLLPEKDTFLLALSVVRNNDHAHFAEAWAALSLALNGGE